MPVGTKATVKAAAPASSRDLGAQIVLGNTYHLLLPARAPSWIAELGGLHRFMGWDGAILTDSGGYQVFSLRDTATIDDDGRRLPVGLRRLAAPLHAGAGDGDPAPPRLRHRDGVRRVPAGRRRAAPSSRTAVRRTSLWARALRARCTPAPGQLVFGIVQGGIDLELRERSAAADRRARLRRLRDRRADGRRGAARRCSPRTRATADDAAGRAAALLHGDRRPGGRHRGDRRRGRHVRLRASHPPRPHRLGARHRAGDSTCETRSTPTTSGRSRRGATCPACATFSRAYIRHLITQDEIVGLRLLTLHNLHVLFELVRGAREAIRAGTFSKYRSTRLSAP